jgi:hypothetical protein
VRALAVAGKQQDSSKHVGEVPQGVTPRPPENTEGEADLPAALRGAHRRPHPADTCRSVRRGAARRGGGAHQANHASLVGACASMPPRRPLSATTAVCPLPAGPLLRARPWAASTTPPGRRAAPRVALPARRVVCHAPARCARRAHRVPRLLLLRAKKKRQSPPRVEAAALLSGPAAHPRRR